MSAVNTVDGVEYGFRLLGYLLAVGLAGGFVLLIGVVVADSSPIFGGLLSLVGLLVIYAGSLGLLYKVIGDGVKVGVEAADFP